MNPDSCLYSHQRVCRGNYWAQCPIKKKSRFSNFFALKPLVALFPLLGSLSCWRTGVKARKSFWTPTIKMPYLIHLLLAVLIPWIFLFMIRPWGNLVLPRPTSLFSWNENKSFCLNLINWRVLFGTGHPGTGIKFSHDFVNQNIIVRHLWPLFDILFLYEPR